MKNHLRLVTLAKDDWVQFDLAVNLLPEDNKLDYKILLDLLCTETNLLMIEGIMRLLEMIPQTKIDGNVVLRYLGVENIQVRVAAIMLLKGTPFVHLAVKEETKELLKKFNSEVV